MKFEKISCINSNQFGNKAQNLCKLINLGFNVPDGICLDYEYFNLYKNDNLTYLIKIKDVFNYIEEHLKSQNGWIVRSSSEIEDSEEFSAAGIYKSIYIDKLDKLYDAIKIVFDSNYNMVNLGARIGVIIQEYIEPEYSGVSFSCNPINNNQKALIEFVKGRCNQIVDGLVIPNRIDFNLEIDNNILIKYPFIKSIEMKTNLLAKKIGKNVDLEWVFKDSKVYLVQLRTVVMKNLPQDNILYKFDALSLGEWVLLDGVALPLTPVEKSLDLSGTLHFRAWDSKIVNDYHYVKFKENMNSNSNNDINFIKEWERNEKKYKKLLKDITDIKTLENIELWDYLVRAIKQSRELYRVYMNRAWFANRKVLQKSLLEDLKTISSNAIEASNLLANLCTEVDSKTLDKQIKLNNLIKFSMKNKSLIPERYEEISQGNNIWCNKFLNFINEFGDSNSSTISFYTKTLRENASYLFFQIKYWTNNTDYKIKAPKCEGIWKRELEKIKNKMNSKLFTKFLFKLIIYRKYLQITENDDYLLEKNISNFKKLFFEISRRLGLSEDEDTFFLYRDEIKEILAENKKYDILELRKKIHKRKENFKQKKALVMPRKIVNGQVEELQKNIKNDQNVMYGNVVSKGISIGRAYILKDPANIEEYLRITENNIVISEFLTPGMTQNIMFARGIVTEVGGFLSHGAIFAREIGLPAVVGVSGAINKIKHGQEIKLDANKGKITILE